MSYLSDASLVVYEHTYYDMLKKADAEGNGEASRLLTTNAGDLLAYDSGGGEKVIIILWNGVKWYPEIAGIRFIEEWMASADAENARAGPDTSEPVPYSFTRIGEDPCDVEGRGLEDCSLSSGYVWISRTLSVTGGAAPFDPEIPPDKDDDPTTDAELMDYLEQ